VQGEGTSPTAHRLHLHPRREGGCRALGARGRGRQRGTSGVAASTGEGGSRWGGGATVEATGEGGNGTGGEAHPCTGSRGHRAPPAEDAVAMVPLGREGATARSVGRAPGLNQQARDASGRGDARSRPPPERRRGAPDREGGTSWPPPRGPQPSRCRGGGGPDGAA
jgi:hypothetical protein